MTTHTAGPGIVSLVGAGPGDPGLLTIRARELLETADAIVYDALINHDILVWLALPPHIALHDVGKRGGAPSARQDDINALLVRLGREGKRVVRLKGGDPFVFGRGSEEALALAAAGVPFEVVSGVTAGVAVPAYAGIPVTHRGFSSMVTFVTGRESPDRAESHIDWATLGRLHGTLVVYMGARRLAEITAALAAGGLSGETPVAVVSWGTYPHQRTVSATLDTVAAAARDAGIESPSIVIIGDVVRLHDEIGWFDRRPLHGRRIVVTRARPQASELAARLRALGAEAIEAPAIRIEPLDPTPLRATLARLPDYGWAVFTSQHAVEIVWDVLRAAGRDARALAGVRLAAVGPATAAALLARGLAVDVMPARFVAEGLADALLARGDVRGARVLFAKAEGAREVLPAALRDAGAVVDEVAIYRTVADPESAAAAREALERNAVDFLTFTSSSAVRFFVDAVGPAAAARAPIATMGPVTSAAVRALGLPVALEAPAATIDALLDAIVAAGGRA